MDITKIYPWKDYFIWGGILSIGIVFAHIIQFTPLQPIYFVTQLVFGWTSLFLLSIIVMLIIKK